MTTYFHAGRECRLGSEAQFVDLAPVWIPESPSDEQTARQLFPRGLSRHGEQYLLHGHHDGNKSLMPLELLMEEIRAHYYPRIPSRFVSIFASLTLEAARDFGRAYSQRRRNSCFDIREVECKSASVHDMDWINAQHSTVLDRIRAIHAYWQQQAKSNPPNWEALISLPASVGARIEIYSWQQGRWVATSRIA